MIVESCRFEKAAGTSRFEACVLSEGAIQPTSLVRFEFHADLPSPVSIGDGFLAAMLVPAMFAGETLEIRAPVSARLTRTVEEVQRIMSIWYPDMLSRVRVITPSIVATPQHEDDGPMASFFSGGVDSWFSAIRYQARLSALVLVKGFDIPHSDTKIWPEAVSGAEASATAIGAKLITVETNVRDCVDPGLGCFKRLYRGSDFWGACYHGSCLDAVALFMQQRFSCVVVPASWHYTRLQPWGSHPLLDCLLSNGRVEILHDGADASRMDKLREIVKAPAALRHLRVCPDFTRGVYNCGQCEKCCRTLLALRALGVREEDVPFQSKLNLPTLELNPPKPYLRPLYLEILGEARRRGDPELIRCLGVLCGETWSARGEWFRWSSRMKRSFHKRFKSIPMLGRERMEDSPLRSIS